MARFNRPAGSIENVADLKVGDHIWEVCGIWPPYVGFERIVTRAPMLFRDYPGYFGGTQGDHTVFDISYASDPSLVVMWFATDGNMQPGYSHNDSYWFRSQEEAEAACKFLRAEWEKQPDLIADEVQRRELDREMNYDCDAA